MFDKDSFALQNFNRAFDLARARNPSTYVHELIKVLLRFDPAKQQ